MSTEITPECIKKTQEILGKFIKKPVLTDRLLTKPPFRFLHDICTAAMRETGFFEGVLNSGDCKAENIKDKDGKIAFLQKVIAAVEEANGVKLPIKPNKVVAGYEPANTNDFLQALGMALEKQQQQKQHQEPCQKEVALPKNNTTKSETMRSKSKSVKKPENEGENKKKTTSTKLTKADRPSENKITEKNLKRGSSEKVLDKSTSKKNEVTQLKNEEKNSLTHAKLNDDEHLAGHNEILQKKKSQVPVNNSSEVIDNSETKQSEEITKEYEKEVKVDSQLTDMKRPQSAKPGHRRSLSISESAECPVPGKSVPDKDNNSPDITKSEIPINAIFNDHATKRAESVIIKMNKMTSGSPPNFQTKDSDGKDEPSPILRPRTGLGLATSRPTSARPAAPRIRDRGDLPVHEDIVKATAGSVEIIPDKMENNDPDEDENVVVMEPGNELLTDEWNDRDCIRSTNSEDQSQSEHGLLVEQILETQKQLDQNRLTLGENINTGTTEIECRSNRIRESTDREIKKLRICIQSLTRSVNPLGKLLDYLQEDVDIMQKELSNWKDMNSDLEIQISQERSLTEQSIEPLKIHLKEVQQMIDQQLEQMTVVKGNILRSDQRIQKLLMEIK